MVKWIYAVLVGLVFLWFGSGCMHEGQGNRTFRLTMGSPFIFEVSDRAEDYAVESKMVADPLTDWLFKAPAPTPAGEGSAENP